MSRTELDIQPCLDIVRPFTVALDDYSAASVQIFGGIGSAALEHPQVDIQFDEQSVSVPANALDRLMQRRPDGTLRDLDCLVLSTDEAAISNVEALANQHIPKGALALSFFGLKSLSQLQKQRAHPGLSIAKVFLSDRYVREEAGVIVEAKKALFPFAVDMPLETLETWQLHIDGEDSAIPIPHPGATVLNYLTRSISGLRPKDADKVGRLLGNIAQAEPDILGWITDGPGASQLDFARILHTLRSPREQPQSLQVGNLLAVEPYNFDDLIEHPAFGDFMVRGRPGLLKLLVEAERVKSRGLHFAESQQKIVTAWQSYAEGHFQTFVKNS